MFDYKFEDKGHKRLKMMRPPQDTLPPNTVRRDKWDAVPPRMINLDVVHPVNHILLDHTGTEPCSTEAECKRIVKELQTNHMTVHDLPDIKQNFFFGGDGNVYVGRGWVSDPALPKDYQSNAGDILYFSFFGPKGRKPSEEELKIFSNFMEIGKKHQFIVEKPTIHQEL